MKIKKTHCKYKSHHEQTFTAALHVGMNTTYDPNSSDTAAKYAATEVTHIYILFFTAFSVARVVTCNHRLYVKDGHGMFN